MNESRRSPALVNICVLLIISSGATVGAFSRLSVFEAILALVQIMSIVGIAWLGGYGVAKSVAIEAKNLVVLFSTLLISSSLLYSELEFVLRALLLVIALTLIGVYIVSALFRS